MKSAKRGVKLWLLGALTAALCLSATAVYAYFTAVTPGWITDVGADGADASVVTVATPYELAVAAAGRVDSSTAADSAPDDRANLKLGASIVLDRDLVFFSDASLDLGGFALDFNGHSITIAHTYRTTAKFVNGTFEDSAADADRAPRIRADGGCTVTTASIVVGGIAAGFGYRSADDFVRTAVLSADELAAAAKDFVAARLYPYYIGNIALPTHFGSYDLRFRWSAVCGVAGLTDDNGNVDADVYDALDVETPVTLRLRLDGAVEAEFDFFVVLIPKSGLSARAEAEFAAALAPYAYSDASGATRYLVGAAFVLPRNNAYLGFNYEAAVSLRADGASEAQTLSASASGEVRVPASGDIRVEVTVKKGAETIGAFAIALRAVVDSPVSIAAKIVDLYSAYVFRKVGDENPLLDEESLWDMGVVDTAYSFVNNEYTEATRPEAVLSYYELDETKRVIRLLAVHDTSVNVYLRVRLTFAGESEAIGKDVRLICLTDSGGSGESPGEDTEADLYAFACAQLDAALAVGEYGSFAVLNRFRGYAVRYYAEDARPGATDPSGGRILTQTIAEGRAEFVYRTAEIPVTDTVICFRFQFGDNTDYYDRDYRFVVKGILQPSDFPDAGLRTAVVDAYDANGDGILATAEAETERALFAYDGSCATFAGLSRLSGTKAFDLSAAAGATTTAEDLLLCLPGEIEVLRASGRGLTATDGLRRLARLRELDLSRNSLTAFAAGGLPRLIKLSLAGNALASCPVLSDCPLLADLDLSGNAIPVFDALLDDGALASVSVYDNVAADPNFGGAGTLNDYTFLLLTRRGVTVYRDAAGVPFASDAAARKAALVLQGVMLDLGGTEISLPLRLYASSATDYYEAEWFENDFDHAIAGTEGADTVSFTPTAATELLIVRITVTVTAEGAEQTATVTRAFVR